MSDTSGGGPTWLWRGSRTKPDQHLDHGLGHGFEYGLGDGSNIPARYAGLDYVHRIEQRHRHSVGRDRDRSRRPKPDSKLELQHKRRFVFGAFRIERIWDDI